LLVNDHILKPAPWAPGWLTGKLSDVAGLFFFPRLLTLIIALLPLHLIARQFDPAPQHQRHMLVSCVLTGLAFTALQLSPLFVELTHALLDPLWTPLTSRPVQVTMDPTDLLALPMLVLSHRLDRQKHNTP